MTGASGTDGAPASGFGWWNDVLAEGRRNPRLDILQALPDADHRLDRLKVGLTVAEVVGLANALFNNCDPSDLKLESAVVERQAEMAWDRLAEAKRSPRLGGNWSGTVSALEAHQAEGLRRLLELNVERFFTAVFRIVSQVYRKV